MATKPETTTSDETHHEIRLWQGAQVRRSIQDGFFDATQMCAAAGGGKRFAQYARTQRAIEYKATLQRMLKEETGGADVEVTRVTHGGQEGSWVHPRIAIDLSRWLSPVFAVWMDGWILAQFSRSPSAPPLDQGAARHFHHQFSIVNETDLHLEVVKWIRRFYPDAELIAGLGELQDTDSKRLEAWGKGYKSGQPDLLILNWHCQYSGFALEMKHPGFKELRVSAAQQDALSRLAANNFKVIASNDFHGICFEIRNYMEGLAPSCEHCKQRFQSKTALKAHVADECSVAPRKKQRRTTIDV